MGKKDDEEQSKKERSAEHYEETPLQRREERREIKGRGSERKEMEDVLCSGQEITKDKERDDEMHR
ncbi:hypothetical protein E2C01_078280 [Portunus trituberculatus]|uniref:Uncharacterized protein n=1 Tax=Portunus trituberculatus TaxID=210409 RepID=A0A5B7ISB4_PORTR|nr:hypothetical protein [Portunus trituberculatus]